MLLVNQAVTLSSGAGDAFVASPALHGAGGPLDELISMGVLGLLMVVTVVIFIWSGSKKK